MNERDWLAERFEENRADLRAVAYRVLGSASEADDAVQETWLRLSRSGADGVENLGGWLTTIVARVALNMLSSRASRREEPIDSPAVSSAAGADHTDPEHEAVLADSLGLALLVVLDTLTPAERLAFVLHDMFAVPFDEIAPIVDRSPAAARQLASRARRRVQQADAAPEAEAAVRRDIVRAFLAGPLQIGHVQGDVMKSGWHGARLTPGLTRDWPVRGLSHGRALTAACGGGTALARATSA